jgi:hypothetical protein
MLPSAYRRRARYLDVRDHHALPLWDVGRLGLCKSDPELVRGYLVLVSGTGGRH